MPETFDEKSVYRYLHTPDLHITVLSEVTSTNTLLAQEAQKGAPEGTVLAAHCQSGGRGHGGVPLCGGRSHCGGGDDPLPGVHHHGHAGGALCPHRAGV